MLDNKAALVLFSGGQDSTICLAWALKQFERVETIGFDYGQRHVVELECRTSVLRALPPAWRERLGPDHPIELASFGALSDTALTREVAIGLDAGGLPNTFVPGRNLLFLTYAAAIAYRRGLRHLVAGMCETDYSGYPDCRDDSVKAMQVTLNLAMATNFVIHTPLMWRDKAATWALAAELGDEALIDLIVEHSHSCYLGSRAERHDWGYGCGTCPACEIRARGYAAFQRSNW